MITKKNEMVIHYKIQTINRFRLEYIQVMHHNIKKQHRLNTIASNITS